MQRPPAQCTTPGCPTRHRDKGRCPRCRAKQPARTHWRDLYGSEWPVIRLDYLARHPICALCGHLADIPDHHPTGIRALRRQGVTDPHADHRLRPLCTRCHNAETWNNQPSAWQWRRE